MARDLSANGQGHVFERLTLILEMLSKNLCTLGGIQLVSLDGFRRAFRDAVRPFGRKASFSRSLNSKSSGSGGSSDILGDCGTRDEAKEDTQTSKS